MREAAVSRCLTYSLDVNPQTQAQAGSKAAAEVGARGWHRHSHLLPSPGAATQQAAVSLTWLQGMPERVPMVERSTATSS